MTGLQQEESQKQHSYSKMLCLQQWTLKLQEQSLQIVHTL